MRTFLSLCLISLLLSVALAQDAVGNARVTGSGAVVITGALELNAYRSCEVADDCVPVVRDCYTKCCQLPALPGHAINTQYLDRATTNVEPLICPEIYVECSPTADCLQVEVDCVEGFCTNVNLPQREACDPATRKSEFCVCGQGAEGPEWKCPDCSNIEVPEGCNCAFGIDGSATARCPPPSGCDPNTVPDPDTCECVEFERVDGTVGERWQCNLCANIDLAEGCECDPTTGRVACPDPCANYQPDPNMECYCDPVRGEVCPQVCDADVRPSEQCRCQQGEWVCPNCENVAQIDCPVDPVCKFNLRGASVLTCPAQCKAVELPEGCVQDRECNVICRPKCEGDAETECCVCLTADGQTTFTSDPATGGVDASVGMWACGDNYCPNQCPPLDSIEPGCTCNPFTGDIKCAPVCDKTSEEASMGCPCYASTNGAVYVNDEGVTITGEWACEIRPCDRVRIPEGCGCDPQTGAIHCACESTAPDGCACDPSTGEVRCKPICNAEQPGDCCRCVAAQFLQAPEDGSTGVWDCAEDYCFNPCDRYDTAGNSLPEGCTCDPNRDQIVQCEAQCEGEKPFDDCWCSYYADATASGSSSGTSAEGDFAAQFQNRYAGGWVCPVKCDPNTRPAEDCTCASVDGSVDKLQWVCRQDRCDPALYPEGKECTCGYKTHTELDANVSPDGVDASSEVAVVGWVCREEPEICCDLEQRSTEKAQCETDEASLRARQVCNPDSCEWEFVCPEVSPCECSGADYPQLTKEVHGCTTNEATIWCERNVVFTADGQEAVAPTDFNDGSCGRWQYTCNKQIEDFCKASYDCGQPTCLDSRVVQQRPLCDVTTQEFNCRDHCMREFATCAAVRTSGGVASCEFQLSADFKLCVDRCEGNDNTPPTEFACGDIRNECSCTGQDQCSWCKVEYAVEGGETRSAGRCMNNADGARCRSASGVFVYDDASCEEDECRKPVDSTDPNANSDTAASDTPAPEGANGEADPAMMPPPPEQCFDEQPPTKDEVSRCANDARCMNESDFNKEIDEQRKQAEDGSFEKEFVITVQLVISGSSAQDAEVVSLSVDVTGSRAVEDNESEALCGVIKRTFANIIGIDVERVAQCTLKRVTGTTTKRTVQQGSSDTTSSYIADLEVAEASTPSPGPSDGPTDEPTPISATSVIPAMALLFVSAFLAF